MSTNLNIQADQILDCKGLACPMPIVRTKKAMELLEEGKVIEVQATDKGSLADIQGWAKNTGHHYLGTVQENAVLRHYLRKSTSHESKEDKKYPHTATNAELEQKLASLNGITILDVREPAEFAFHHIPNAESIPLGDLERRSTDLNPDNEIYVICRTGSRSDMAAQLLAEKGFKQVLNVIPGMAEWTGPTVTANNE